MCRVVGCRAPPLDQRRRERLGIELAEVLGLFADADEADRQLSLRAMATTMPPWAVPSSLVSTSPVTPIAW